MQKNSFPFLIHEFDETYFVIGEHQFHKGYAVLYLKEHQREMIDLSFERQQKIFAELMKASQALHKVFQPYKMNYACLGNQVEHIHWHLFPRYLEDPHFKEHPWWESARFAENPVNEQQAREFIANVKKFL